MSVCRIPYTIGFREGECGKDFFSIVSDIDIVSGWTGPQVILLHSDQIQDLKLQGRMGSFLDELIEGKIVNNVFIEMANLDWELCCRTSEANTQSIIFPGLCS